MKRLSLLLLPLLMASCTESTLLPTDQLQPGDLLFVAAAQTDLEQAIAGSTTPADSAQISHVAIVCQQGGDLYALEAYPGNGVWLCPISEFISRDGDDPTAHILAGRLRDTLGITASVERALSLLNRPYDDYYEPGDSAIYCSELVQLTYARPDGSPVFSCQPMSFHDAQGTVLPYWIEHYREAGLQVPEGEPGTNPAALAHDPAVELIGCLH